MRFSLLEWIAVMVSSTRRLKVKAQDTKQLVIRDEKTDREFLVTIEEMPS